MQMKMIMDMVSEEKCVTCCKSLPTVMPTPDGDMHCSIECCHKFSGVTCTTCLLNKNGKVCLVQVGSLA